VRNVRVSSNPVPRDPALDDDCLTKLDRRITLAPKMNSSDTAWPSQGVSSIVARVGPSNFGASKAMQENSRGNQPLDRRIAVAPMMDWTDAVNFPRGIMCLDRRETPCLLYVAPVFNLPDILP
jgi:hypothetical protein